MCVRCIAIVTSGIVRGVIQVITILMIHKALFAADDLFRVAAASLNDALGVL